MVRGSKARYGLAVVAVLLAALGLRVGYMELTPGYEIVHDARDYDAHARSIAIGDGFSKRLTGKPTAFRPPGYPYLLGGAYRVFGVERGRGCRPYPTWREGSERSSGRWVWR